MKPSATNRCADALYAMRGDCTSSRFYRARTTANGSAIRHDRQRRHAGLSEPAPPRRVDGDLSPRRLARPLAVVARGRQSDARRRFQTCRLEIPSTAQPHRRIFARRKEWRLLSTPIDSAGRRRFSPIRLCLTGAAPTSCAPRRLRAPPAKPKTLSIIIHLASLATSPCARAPSDQPSGQGEPAKFKSGSHPRLTLQPASLPNAGTRHLQPVAKTHSFAVTRP